MLSDAPISSNVSLWLRMSSFLSTEGQVNVLFNSSLDCLNICSLDHSFPHKQQIFPNSTGQFAIILQLTAANFPRIRRIAINFLWPLNLTKYAVFVAGKLPQVTDTVCLANKLVIFQISSISSIFPR